MERGDRTRKRVPTVHGGEVAAAHEAGQVGEHGLGDVGERGDADAGHRIGQRPHMGVEADGAAKLADEVDPQVALVTLVATAPPLDRRGQHLTDPTRTP